MAAARELPGRRAAPRRGARRDVRAAARPPGRHAWEFRDPGWFTDEVLDLLRRHRAAVVAGDHPARPWQPLVATAPPAFVRLHFGARGRRGNYSRTELEAWVPELAALAEHGDVLVPINNDWEGFVVRNARLLRRLLDAAGVGARAPPPPARRARGTGGRRRPGLPSAGAPPGRREPDRPDEPPYSR